MLLICSVSTATNNLYVITVGQKLQRGTLYDTRRDVQLKHFIALNVPTFRKVVRLT